VELEQRLARLEVCCAELIDFVKVADKRLTALQAQLDHLTAKLLGRS
jgi:hypothetical protein